MKKKRLLLSLTAISIAVVLLLTGCPLPQAVPPAPPSNPVPTDSSVQYISLDLGWSTDSSTRKYDVYFGDDPDNLDLIAQNLEVPELPELEGLYPLEAMKTYYWKVVVKAVSGLSTEGPVWSFETRDVTPYNPLPSDGILDCPLDPTLEWTCVGPEDTEIYFDIYFREGIKPILV